MRHRTVFGVGINDATYSVGGGKCPYYSIWLSMLNRCYSKKGLLKQSLYFNCSVTPEWHLFSNFKLWVTTQIWEGKSLDKDLRVPGNRVYGPTTCLFISQAANTILNSPIKQRNGLPTGVHKHGSRFKVNLKYQGKTKHIGVYDSIEEARICYLNTKAGYVEELALQEAYPLARVVLFKAAAKIRMKI